MKQNYTVDEKNKIWCTDFTYMRQPNGRFRYNCSIIDLFDRSAAASMNSDYINTELAKDTLNAALRQEKHPKNLILHSDQGQQFAPMERFYNTFKSCFYYRFTFESVEMLDEMTKEDINWYN